MTMPQTDSPTNGFRPFFNPATGEWITYTAIAANSHGQLVRFNWRSVPGGVITEHIHPRQEERFTILAGEAHFTLDGEQRIARAGETVVVPAGVPHSEGNPGPGEIEGVVELRPALRAKEFHEALAGLVADGKTTPRGAPKNPLHLLALPPREPGHLTPHPGAEPHAPAAMGPGQGLRHTPLLQPLGQPDLSSWPVPPPGGRRDLLRRIAGPLRDWDRYRTPISWALAMASWRVDTPSFR
jgi:quercetin dioxygenase-like cupin family protein